MVQIDVLSQIEVSRFWPVFQHVLRTQFPGYTPAVTEYLLTKMYTPESFRYWLRNEYKTICSAKQDDQIVGFAIIDAPYGGVSFCRWLGVLEDHQQKGIGTDLVHKWINLAKSQGCHKIEVAGQPEAKQFYEKMGLELEGYRKKSYFGIDQYIFGKVLGQPDDKVMTTR
jgi:GNAT superfamily N-acetyltransferase